MVATNDLVDSHRYRNRKHAWLGGGGLSAAGPAGPHRACLTYTAPTQGSGSALADARLAERRALDGARGALGLDCRQLRLPHRVRVQIIVGEPMELKNPEGGRVPTSTRKAFTDNLRKKLQEVFDQSRET